MTDQQIEQPITSGELRELAGKVVDWRKTLSPKERAFMDAVIQRAVSAEADVQGYVAGLMPNLFGNPPTGDPTHHTATGDANEIEEFQFAFQKISVSFSNGSKTANDSWVGS